MFTKKHYDTVAAIFRTNREEGPKNSQDAVEQIVQAFVHTFQKDNPRFDAARFVKAAGWPELVAQTLNRYASDPTYPEKPCRACTSRDFKKLGRVDQYQWYTCNACGAHTGKRVEDAQTEEADARDALDRRDERNIGGGFRY